MASLVRPRLAAARGVVTRSWSPGWLAGMAAIALLLLVIGLPLYWMLIAAFKTPREIFTIPPTWLPVDPTLANFPEAWTAAPFGHFYVNSVLITVVSGGMKVLMAVLCGYAFAYLRFPGREVLFVAVLAALMIPDEITVLPNYLTVAELGWVDTYAGLLVPGFASAFGAFLMRQHFLALPREVLEAARVDGAGHLRMLWSVVLPMSRPVLVTLILLTAVGRWNEFMWPLIVTSSAEMRPLSVGIYFLFSQEGTTVWGVVMAGTLFVVLPVVLLFIWAQRHIVSGLTAGAVKG